MTTNTVRPKPRTTRKNAHGANVAPASISAPCMTRRNGKTGWTNGRTAMLELILNSLFFGIPALFLIGFVGWMIHDEFTTTHTHNQRNPHK